MVDNGSRVMEFHCRASRSIESSEVSASLSLGNRLTSVGEACESCPSGLLRPYILEPGDELSQPPICHDYALVLVYLSQ